jgi:inosine/xanthosine triphosphate pyrophosphatase family protein
VPKKEIGTITHTWAEITSEEKNKVSHRRRAVEAMRNDLGLQ